MKPVIFFTYLLGIGLPVLETYRGGFDHWLVHSMTMAGDCIMGSLLLAAALCLALKKRYAPLLLVIAWSCVLGVMNAASGATVRTRTWWRYTRHQSPNARAITYSRAGKASSAA